MARNREKRSGSVKMALSVDRSAVRRKLPGAVAAVRPQIAGPGAVLKIPSLPDLRGAPGGLDRVDGKSFMGTLLVYISGAFGYGVGRSGMDHGTFISATLKNGGQKWIK